MITELFPERDNAEVTCGWVYSHPDKQKLGPASERQTYESIRKWYAHGIAIIEDNYAGCPRHVYVVGGCVQDKSTGKRFPGKDDGHA